MDELDDIFDELIDHNEEISDFLAFVKEQMYDGDYLFLGDEQTGPQTEIGLSLKTEIIESITDKLGRDKSLGEFKVADGRWALAAGIKSLGGVLVALLPSRIQDEGTRGRWRAHIGTARALREASVNRVRYGPVCRWGDRVWPVCLRGPRRTRAVADSCLPGREPR